MGRCLQHQYGQPEGTVCIKGKCVLIILLIITQYSDKKCYQNQQSSKPLHRDFVKTSLICDVLKSLKGLS